MLFKLISRKYTHFIPYKTIKTVNTQAVVSFCFDDFALSAVANGASILEKYHCRGTFFTCGNLWGQMENGNLCAGEDEIFVLKNAGHEIGCHTFSHFDCQQVSRTDLNADLAKNSKLIRSVTGLDVDSFAFPRGMMDRASQNVVAKYYATARTVLPGINYQLIDPFALRAYPLYSKYCDLDMFRSVIVHAIDRKAWLIFYTHDVSDNPSPYGITPEEYEAVVKMVYEKGVTVMPIQQAFRYVVSSK